MKSTELLGAKAKSFIEWHCMSATYSEVYKSFENRDYLRVIELEDIVRKFYSQPITEDTFGLKTECDICKGVGYTGQATQEQCSKCGGYGEMETQPIFKGEWERKGNYLIRRDTGYAIVKFNKDALVDVPEWDSLKTLNDLITNSPVELEWNEFEI